MSPTRKPKAIPTPITTASSVDLSIEWNAAEQLQAAESLDQLVDFAQRLKTRQECSCGAAVSWAAAANDQTFFGCDQHIAGMLDRHWIWFLHPVPMG